jgi:hypothetical protein
MQWTHNLRIWWKYIKDLLGNSYWMGEHYPKQTCSPWNAKLVCLIGSCHNLSGSEARTQNSTICSLGLSLKAGWKPSTKRKCTISEWIRRETKRQSTVSRENRHTTRATNVRNLYLVAHYIENYNKLINKNLYLVPPIISMCWGPLNW